MAGTKRPRRSTTGRIGTPHTSLRASAGELLAMRRQMPRSTWNATALASPDGGLYAPRHRPGTLFPTYVLSEHRGVHRKLADLRGTHLSSSRFPSFHRPTTDTKVLSTLRVG